MEVVYYEGNRGRQPAREFIDGLNPKMKAKPSAGCCCLRNMASGFPCPLPVI